jgi:probable rRNA maturation factor
LLRLLRLKDAELSILFVNDRQMKELNQKYRGIDRTTDVLSFPQHSAKVPKCLSAKVNEKKVYGLWDYGTKELLLGDIVINIQTAKRQAPEHELTFNEEFRWLLVHGILHLIGYDHERSKYAERKMRTMERDLLERI